MKKNSLIKKAGFLIILCLLTQGCAEIVQNNDEEKISVKGRVVDGPIKESVCFADLNNNGIKDDNEPVGNSNDKGYYEYDIDESVFNDVDQLKSICIGGIDTTTNQDLGELKLTTAIPKTNLDSIIQTTPLTSLLSSAATVQDKKAILKKLNIQQNESEILTTDYYEIALSASEG